jgi:hypothetical protein
MINLKNQIGKPMIADKIKSLGKEEGRAEERIAILNKLSDDAKIEYTREELSQILGIADEQEQPQNPPISIDDKKEMSNQEYPNVMRGKPLKVYKGKRKGPGLLDELKAEGKEEGKIEEKIAIINKLIDDSKIKYSPDELSKKIWEDE